MKRWQYKEAPCNFLIIDSALKFGELHCKAEERGWIEVFFWQRFGYKILPLVPDEPVLMVSHTVILPHSYFDSHCAGELY